MKYIFISDFENTLTNTRGILTTKTINDIKKLNNKLFIITYSTYDEISNIIRKNSLNCDFFSIISQMGMINNKLESNKINHKILNTIIDEFSDYIYTAYTTDPLYSIVINFQERLTTLYPKNFLEVEVLEKDVANIIIAINHPHHTSLYEALEYNNLSYKILASDSKRDIVLISKTTYSKADIAKMIKKTYNSYSTVGIGDSESDFEFIRHCDIKLAMKNADEELKKLCDKTTELDCDNNGCMYELLKLNNA